MRRSMMAALISVLLLVPQSGWGQSAGARVGARTIGNLEVTLYVWGPQEVLHPKGSGHHTPQGEATHHLDVRVYDLHRGIYIPYLTVTATVTDQTKQREVSVELDPMIGEWLHYGSNITLPHPGTYSILLAIKPPDIARYKYLADVWNTPVQALFTYEYR